jgi:hypothetical protein
LDLGYAAVEIKILGDISSATNGSASFYGIYFGTFMFKN